MTEGVSTDDLMRIIRANPGITTPELADRLGVSVTMARWVVGSCGWLEFYNGNHIREKVQEKA